MTPPAPDSRPAAELAVRIALIDLANSGCEQCGGIVVTTSVPIVWQQENQPGIRHYDGTVGGTRFTADYHAGSGWAVQIWAC